MHGTYCWAFGLIVTDIEVAKTTASFLALKV